MKVIVVERLFIPGSFPTISVREMFYCKSEVNAVGMWTQPWGGWCYPWRELRPYTELTAILLGMWYESLD